MDYHRFAEDFGTPTYVYEHERLVENVRFFLDELRQTDLLAVAIKANSNPVLLSILADLGAGADIVSGGEMYAALAAGISPERIIFSGVGKTDTEIEAAIVRGIGCLNVESSGECERIRAIARKLGKKVCISFRINPNIAIDSHPKISTGMWEHKFGMSESEVVEQCRSLSKAQEIQVLGFHTHLGSQILDRAPLDELLSHVPRLAASLEKALGYPLTWINWGGGYGVGPDGERPSWLRSWIHEAVAQSEKRNVRAVFEPGRSIFANTAVLLTRIIEIKKTDRKAFVIVDAGMNDLIRPALYGAIHPITLEKPASGKTIQVDVVGPVCESSDTFATNLTMDASVGYGDLLLIHHAGAYGYSMASTYNLRARPAEVLIAKDGSARSIRVREPMPS